MQLGFRCTPEPIRVSPWITQPGSIRVSGPIETPAST
jgi:hypothetical protein